MIRRGVLWGLGYRDLGVLGPGKLMGRVLGSIPSVRLRALWGFLLVPEARSAGRLLDVGCGNGRFLAAMRALGWEVMGVEPDPVSRSIAESVTGAPVLPSLAEAQFPHDESRVRAHLGTSYCLKEILPLAYAFQTGPP